MIYWYTGQPGHGKTLHAIDHALSLRDEGRLVYVGNVRGFKYDEARVLPITPEQFCDWHNFLPDGAVCLIDEAYEHGMLPKRSPGSKVPDHVRELAKHRHRGIDFIFVSQSPKKQVDEFVHDLIERHTHVRRRFGLPFAHLRIFDRFESNPEKGHPLTLKRVKLPKRPMGLYESTVLDTVEKSIPWYYIAAAILLVAVVVGAYTMINRVEAQLSGKDDSVIVQGGAAAGPEKNGAGATVAEGPPPKPTGDALRKSDYVAWLTPRIEGQPWTAPAYDELTVPPQAPRLYCMASGDPYDSCTCQTEQGTSYAVNLKQCVMIATRGQYEPFRDENIGDRRRLDDMTQYRQWQEQRTNRTTSAGVGAAHGDALNGSVMTAPQIGAYGDLGVSANPGSAP